MPKRAPEYPLQDFIDACGRAKAVIVLKPAITEAPSVGLHGPQAILAWIAEHGIENHEHANTTKWENDPHPSNPLMVDSYNFSNGGDLLYIAFMCNPETGKWLLKSFKKNNKDSPKTTLEEKLREAGLI